MLAWVAKNCLVGARWTASVPPPVPTPTIVGRTDPLWWNEA